MAANSTVHRPLQHQMPFNMRRAPVEQAQTTGKIMIAAASNKSASAVPIATPVLD